MTAATTAAECLGDETIFEFVQGKLPEAALAKVEEHLNRCADCRAVVAETAKFFFDGSDVAGGARERTLDLGLTNLPTVAAARAGRRALPAGSLVSRYQLGEPLGAGGAGVVYRGYDPQLKRRIALKLIEPDRRAIGARGEAHETRLLREAQAMAQLSHPNVVAVFDAGTWQGQVFIVMELVEGRTLAHWLGAESHDWREIVDVFLDAGRGLAAAHAAGLVHRDFKPENVLLGSDGRARVTDFGLARPAAIDPDAHGAGALAQDVPTPPPVTDLAGATAGSTSIAGTPAYMAPEQFLGKEADARTDQFSFCVALYAALYGRRPFGPDELKGLTLLSYANEVITGNIRPLPEGLDVPPWVRPILVRGLRVRPEERYPAIGEILADLQRGGAPPASRARRRSVLPVALALSGLAAAAGIVWWSAGPAARRPAAPEPIPPPLAATPPAAATQREVAPAAATEAATPEPAPTMPGQARTGGARLDPPVDAMRRPAGGRRAAHGATTGPAAAPARKARPARLGNRLKDPF